MQSLAEAARSTLTSLAAYWLTLWALTGALDILLDTGVEMAPVREPLMIAWFGASIALFAARFFSRGPRVAALLGLTAGLGAYTVLLHTLTGLVAPWLQITIAAGMVLTSFGFLADVRVFLVAAPIVVVLMLVPQRYDEIARPGTPVTIGVPLMEALLVLGLGLLAALIRLVMLRSAERADRTMNGTREQRQQALTERVRADALSAQMSLLHDTALNTLHAVALAPDGVSAEAQRERCRADAERLRSIGAGWSAPTFSFARSLRALSERVEAQGLELRLDVEADSREVAALPRSVSEAVLGAIEECVQNVVKHASVPTAVVTVHVSAGRVRAQVSDAGVGFDPNDNRTGFGIDESVLHRMQTVGGRAAVHSRPGHGTTVTLEWRRSAPETEPVQDAVSAVVVRLMVLLLATSTVFMAGLVVAEWGAFERPGIAFSGAIVLGAWGLLVTSLLRRRRWIPTSIGVLTVAIACVAPFWTVASDRYCASSFSGIGWIDPRVPLIVMVIVTSGVWWRATVAVPVFIAAVLVAGQLWGEAYPGCDGNAVVAATSSLSIFVASLMAARTLNRQADEVAAAQGALDEAENERLRADALRAERQHWYSPAVASCIPLLEEIADGRADPAADDVRRRCREVAGHLRGLISVAQAPEQVRDGLRAALESAHLAGVRIAAQGDFAALAAPEHDLNALLQAQLPRSFGLSQSLTVTALPEPGLSSITLLAPGTHAPDQQHALDDARLLVPPGTHITLDGGDGYWMELSWEVAEPAREAPLSPASATHTPGQSAGSP